VTRERVSAVVAGMMVVVVFLGYLGRIVDLNITRRQSRVDELPWTSLRLVKPYHVTYKDINPLGRV
jgi:hypothetical protein